MSNKKLGFGDVKTFIGNIETELPNVSPGADVILKLTNDSVTINVPEGFKTKNIANLNYEKIIETETSDSREYEEKDKSIIGRGIIGGVLFGPAGAVVGGLSGTGKKKKNVITYYLAIKYKNNEDENTILLSTDTKSFAEGIEKTIRKMADIKDEQSAKSNQPIDL